MNNRGNYLSSQEKVIMRPVGIVPNLGEILNNTVRLGNKQDCFFVVVLWRLSKLDLPLLNYAY